VNAPDWPSKLPPPEELPTWMRPYRRVVDWGLLIVLAFGLLAIYPFLTRGELPRDTNAELYEFRSLEVTRVLRDGVFYSRWAPDLNYGYGSPIFTFLAPLPHYLSGYHQVFTETGVIDSLRLMFALSILGAGTGMYLFARGRWGIASGVLAGLLYMYSGPIVLTLPYQLGELALLMGMAILPWCAWSLDRVWRQPGKSSFWLALICMVAFALSETRIAALGTPVLMLVIFSGRRQALAKYPRLSARYIFAAVVLTIGLTAFFWLPALNETGSVQWIAAGTEAYAGPIPLTESLTGFHSMDPQMLNTPLYRVLGIAPWLMAALALAGGIAQRRRIHFGDSGLFLFVGVLLLVTTTPALYTWWPSPYIFQSAQPYHALLMALFCLCAVGGRATLWTNYLPARVRGAGITALCLVPLIAAAPALILPEWSRPPVNIDALTSVRQETQGYHLATLRFGALMPSGVRIIPSPQTAFLDTIIRNKLDRVDRQAFSAESQVSAIDPRALSTTYVVNAVRPLTLKLYMLNYLGWRVSVGDQTVQTRTTSEGLLTFSLPIMNGEVQVQFGDTPARSLATWITLVSGVLLLIATRFQWRAVKLPILSAEAMPRHMLIPLLALLVSYGAISVAVRLNPQSLPDSAFEHALTSATPLPRFLQGGIDFLGYQLPSNAPTIGGELRFSAFWQAARPLIEDNQSEIRLLNPVNRLPVLRVRHRHPAGIPTLNWTLDKYIRDDFVIPIPSNVTPGNYILQVSIGACSANDILPCDNIQGMDASDRLGNVERGAITIPEIIRISGR